MQVNLPTLDGKTRKMLKEQYGSWEEITRSAVLKDGVYVVKLKADTKPDTQAVAKEHYLKGLETLNKKKERRALKKKVVDAFSDLDNGLAIAIGCLESLKKDASPELLGDLDFILEGLGEAEKAYKEIVIYTDNLEKEIKNDQRRSNQTSY